MLSPLQCRLGRTALGLSVRRLAEKAGVAPSTVNRFEMGRVEPSPATLVALRRVMEDGGVAFRVDGGVTPPPGKEGGR